MSMEWWRCKHGAPFDPKWRAVAVRAQSRPGDVWAVFTTLCDRASQAHDRGSLEGLDLEDIAAGLGYEAEEVQRIVDALKAKRLIDDVRIVTWEKHQPKRERDNDDSAERVQRHREAKKRQETTPSDDVTPRNASVTPETPRVEKTRLDTETDSEKTRAATQTALPSPGTPLDFRKEVWSRGVPFLKTCGLEESAARSMLGKWRRDHGDLEVLNALASAEGAAASEPVAYVQKVLNSKGKSNGSAGQHGRPSLATKVLGGINSRARAEREGAGG